jgi:hypothetical protein
LDFKIQPCILKKSTLYFQIPTLDFEIQPWILIIKSRIQGWISAIQGWIFRNPKLSGKQIADLLFDLFDLSGQ